MCIITYKYIFRNYFCVMDHVVNSQLFYPKFHNESCWLFQIWSSFDKIHIVNMEFAVSFQRKQETDHQVLNIPI